MPKNMSSEAAFASEKAASRKKRIGSIGSSARSSQATNAAVKHEPRAERDDDLRRRPPLPVAADERPHDAEQTGAHQAETGQVEPRCGAVGLRQPAERERDQQQPDRHVEPEDPLPRQALDDGAADERPERDGEAADAAPRAERQAALLLRHRRAENRQRQRHDDRAAEPLHRPSEVEQLDGRGQRGRHRAEREDADADREHRRRPKRSPSAAPVSRSTANVSVYAFTVHSRLSSEASRSVRITGIAVVTTRLSSVTMNSAIEVIANVQSVPALLI